MRLLLRTAAWLAAACGAAWSDPCSFTISPGAASVPGDKGSSGTITVAASAPDCPRTATASESWISVTAGAVGVGSGTVSWSVPANPTLAERTGRIQIGNAVFTLTQAPGVCSFSLSSGSANFASAGGSGSFQVSTQSFCSWTATSSAAWVTITSGASGTGAGTVAFAVAANPAAAPRTAAITVGTQTFGITQAPSSCLALSASSTAMTAAGGASTVGVIAAADCAWSALSNADWITLTGAVSGTGSGTVAFAVAPNTQPIARSGTLSIGALTFTVNQAAPCWLSFNPVSASFPAAGGTGSIAVTASASSCDRSASSDASWLTVTSGASGSGSGTIAYTVAANNTTQPRTATLTIGGQPYTVTQASANCTYLLTPALRTWPAAGGSGSFSVTTGCTWTAVSNNPDWLQVSPGAAGAGNGAVNYTVAPNPNAAPRSGSITVGDQVFNVTQLGAACSVTLTPAQAFLPPEGGSGAIEVRASAGCAWIAAATASWISLVAPAGGQGDGTVRFTVAPNAGGQTRAAAITVGDQVFQVTQQAAPCRYSVSPSSVNLPAAGGSAAIQVATACSWTATAAASWITITSGTSGTGEGAVAFTVGANPGAAPRTATLTVGDQTVTVTQAGAACAVSLSPPETSAPGIAGSGSFRVSAAAGCSWTPASRADWIRIVSWSNVSGTGVVNYSYAANPSAEPRSGVIEVSGQTFSLHQGPAEVRVSGLWHAASGARSPLAPGLMVLITGSGLGPAAGVAASGPPIPTELAGVRVLFDGAPAPVLYASESQVNAIAPYSLEGKTSAELVLEYRAARSAPVRLEVAPAAPGLFTLDSSGRGQGAILNQDYSVNGPSNPAARNSVVILYATGEGQTEPPGMDGAPAGQIPPRPRLPVKVEIGGLEAPVLYAGGAPGMAAGVMQVNVLVPARAPAGSATPVRLKVGEYASQPDVTLAIK